MNVDLRYARSGSYAGAATVFLAAGMLFGTPAWVPLALLVIPVAGLVVVDPWPWHPSTAVKVLRLAVLYLVTTGMFSTLYALTVLTWGAGEAVIGSVIAAVAVLFVLSFVNAMLDDFQRMDVIDGYRPPPASPQTV